MTYFGECKADGCPETSRGNGYCNTHFMRGQRERAITGEEAWHGSASGYSNYQCRCDPCRIAWNLYCKENKVRRLAAVDEATIEHGEYRSYVSLGCRCAECKAANAKYAREKRLARMGAPKESASCDCCGKNVSLVLDHDHLTGLFRGWLCHSCNTGIGKLGDTVTGLERAIDYLQRNGVH